MTRNYNLPVTPTIVWFRKDLRLTDHLALRAAVERGPVIPVFIWAPEEEGDWPLGAASRWWLQQTLSQLNDDLHTLNSRLILRQGPTLASLKALIKESGATAVYWHRRYEPAIIQRDKQIKQSLKEAGLEAISYNGSLLYEPWTVSTKAGTPFKVFTPFWKSCLSQQSPASPLPHPQFIPPPSNWPSSKALSSFSLAPRKNWAAGFEKAWTPGSNGAQTCLQKFVNTACDAYQTNRDRVDIDGISRLSPHLHFGEISPRQIWSAVEIATKGAAIDQPTGHPFLRQLGWREFAHHLLFHFPLTPKKPLRPAFETFPWIDDNIALRRWQQGRTGIPLVDAAMRHLWHEGWMPNRARMVVASYLTKNLLINWQAGAAWFWDTLVDADLANNTLGWQWTAGCGADAAPYFRIFNPVSQAIKFDPEGTYIRRWLPPLARYPRPYLYKPWEVSQTAPPLETTYPTPLIDLSKSRRRALEAYQQMRQEQA